MKEPKFSFNVVILDESHSTVSLTQRASMDPKESSV